MGFAQVPDLKLRKSTKLFFANIRVWGNKQEKPMLIDGLLSFCVSENLYAAILNEKQFYGDFS